MISDFISTSKSCQIALLLPFDKAYIKYEQFNLFSERNIFYVIPQKDNGTHKSIKEFELREDEPAILKDELIEVTYKKKIEDIGTERTLQLRRIAYYSQKHNSTFVYLTNQLDIEAMQIVEIYKNRWQIEKFFKKLKQKLPINLLFGRQCQRNRDTDLVCSDGFNALAGFA